MPVCTWLFGSNSLQLATNNWLLTNCHLLLHTVINPCDFPVLYMTDGNRLYRCLNLYLVTYWIQAFPHFPRCGIFFHIKTIIHFFLSPKPRSTLRTLTEVGDTVRHDADFREKRIPLRTPIDRCRLRNVLSAYNCLKVCSAFAKELQTHRTECAQLFSRIT